MDGFDFSVTVSAACIVGNAKMLNLKYDEPVHTCVYVGIVAVERVELTNQTCSKYIHILDVE